MNLERYIRHITHDGKTLADFLVNTIQGNTGDATVTHKLQSVEWLAKFGGFIPEDDAAAATTPKRSRAKSEPNKKPPVTEKQIIHYHIARQIKAETQDGKTCIDFLVKVVEKDEKRGSAENFTTAARMRAIRELLNRGWGSFSYTGRRPRIPSGDNEELGLDLARRIREYTGDGGSIVRMLVEALENEDPKAIEKGAKGARPINGSNYYGAVGFNASQRVWVACELLRRCYDVKTDHITYHDIQAYWDAQTQVDEPAHDADAPADADNYADDYAGSPDIDLLGITPEAIQAEVAKMLAADASVHSAEQTAATTTASAYTPAADQPDGDDYAGVPDIDLMGVPLEQAEAEAAQMRASAASAHSATAIAYTPAGSATAIAEKPAANSDNPESAPRSEQSNTDSATTDNTPTGSAAIADTPIDPIDNTPAAADAPASNAAIADALTRAERRRQQLAARKAENRSPNHDLAPEADITDDEAAFILGDDLILEDQAEIDAFKAYIHERLIARRDANRRLNAPDNPDDP